MFTKKLEEEVKELNEMFFKENKDIRVRLDKIEKQINPPLFEKDEIWFDEEDCIDCLHNRISELETRLNKLETKK